MRRALLGSLFVAMALLAGCDGATPSTDAPVGGTSPRPTPVAEGGSECGDQGACAPANDQVVPDVLGTPIEEACERLLSAGYIGGVRKIKHLEQVDEGAVAQMDPGPGEMGAQGQVIMLTVEARWNIRDLPQDCVPRFPGSY